MDDTYLVIFFFSRSLDYFSIIFLFRWETEKPVFVCTEYLINDVAPQRDVSVFNELDVL